MLGWRPSSILGLLVPALLVASGCQPASPAATAIAARPTAAPPATAAPPPAVLPAGVPRAEVLEAANEAFTRGDTRSAVELYERLVNTPPSAAESAEGARAMETFARFREIVAFAQQGRDEDARRQLEQLQRRHADAPVTAMATQFWHTYGATADLSASCAELTPQLSQVAPTLTQLQQLGVSVQPESFCPVRQ